ncbi:MAG: hypothetical protein OXU81_03045 [Gammaproteobacteria bacterium]|nr:hypothetical protein [Gammaproteobacteria bacterium]
MNRVALFNLLSPETAVPLAVPMLDETLMVQLVTGGLSATAGEAIIPMPAHAGFAAVVNLHGAQSPSYPPQAISGPSTCPTNS